MFRYWRRRAAAAAPAGERSAGCSLGECPAGARATVLCLGCPAHEARRLRALGVFEGAPVGVIDTRGGILLDVQGARLALGLALARVITVRPVPA